MKFLTTIFALLMSLALVAGQRYFLGAPARSFGGQASIRDPRQNRGPVVFPPSPPDAIDESSGVVVGASGYGFVPPQQSQDFYASPIQIPPSSFVAYNYFSSPYTHRFDYF